MVLGLNSLVATPLMLHLLWYQLFATRNNTRCLMSLHVYQVSAEMYSAPSIVLQSRGPDGSVHVFDDFRESYAWLRQNTAEDAKVRGILHP